MFMGMFVTFVAVKTDDKLLRKKKNNYKNKYIKTIRIQKNKGKLSD